MTPRSEAFRLAEGLVVELLPDRTCNLIIPDARCRLRIGRGVLQTLCDVATGAYDEDTFDTPRIAAVVADLAAAGALRPAGVPDSGPASASLSLVEHATLKMAQAGGCFAPGLAPGAEAPPRFSALTHTTEIELPTTTPSPKDLWDTIRTRRSVRTAAERLLPLSDLSALLEYSMRIQRVASDTFGEISFRPTASGGARHPIDGFLAVLRVTDVPAGLYQYDPLGHRLNLLSSEPHDAETIARLLIAGMAKPPRCAPAVSVLFGAVPKRTGCKYQDSALSIVFKDVGCLMQQLYLVGTGLGMQGAAVNGADVVAVERLMGFEEGAHAFVGGFVLW